MVLAALLAAAVAIVVAVLVQGGPRVAGAADHLDAPSATPPPGGDGIGTDITDVYAFQSPADASKAVLILNVNGLASASGIGNGPGPDRPFGTKVPQVEGNARVSYSFHVDADGDARSDVEIKVKFGKPGRDGSQEFEVGLEGAASARPSSRVGRPASASRP